jgi:hypothetical protein
MNNFSIELAAENVADKRISTYFSEVLSSFINGNYRSAVVMLWSVVVADLVYKLQALRDLYQDPVAISILDDIQARQQANPTSPDWEPYLLDQVNQRTHLFEVGDHQHLLNLHRLRHLSAHPVLSSGNLLFAPNKETTRALIRNALEAVLLKPPLFSKRIVGEFVADIGAKKELLPDDMGLRRYLEAKYLLNIHVSVERELWKSLWKFCFRISNPDTDANRVINRRALYLLYQRDPVGIRAFVQENAAFFSEIAPQGAPLEAFIAFLARCPALYGVLTDAAKVPITTYARSSADLFANANFIGNSFEEHVRDLRNFDYEHLRDITDQTWRSLIVSSREVNQEQLVFDVGIKVYCGSQSFDGADRNFARFIEPVINEFDRDRLMQLLSGIEENRQTYWRGRARVDHPLVLARIEAVGGIDISVYPHFSETLPNAD